MKKWIRLTLIIGTFLIVVGIGIQYTFLKPTKINAFIASKIYKAPSNSAFDDDNFYKCVIDYYNKENKTSLPYTTNLTDDQLKIIKEISCDGSSKSESEKIISTKGLEKLTALTSLNVFYNKLSTIDVSNNPALTSLNVRSNKLSTIDVSNNPALTSLNAGFNNLNEIDVSKNPKLTYLNAYGNKLSTIDVSSNPELKYLYAWDNNLSTIDVSSNLTLTYLDVVYNNLSTIDVSSNPELKYLYAWDNNLSTIDVSNNSALTSLNVRSNELNTIDVSSNPELKYLYAWDNNLSTIDVSNNSALTDLNVRSNELNTIDVSNNPALTNLNVSDNNLNNIILNDNYNTDKLKSTFGITNVPAQNINLGNNKKIEVNSNYKLYINNKIVIPNEELITTFKTKLGLQNLTSKIYNEEVEITTGNVENGYTLKIYDGVNEIMSIPINIFFNTNFDDENFYKCVVDSYNKENKTSLPYTTNLTDDQLKTIKEINCSSFSKSESEKIISTKGLEKLTALMDLSVYNNKISTIDVSSNPALTSLSVSDNKISTIDVSSNPKLTSLHVNNNKISTIDVSRNPELKYLYVSDNNLSTIDINNNLKLMELGVSDNNISTIDVSNNPVLTYLHVYGNNLSTIDVSSNPELKYLYASYTNLSTIDVSNNPALECLYVYNNKLSTIDVSNNPKLTDLSVYNNKLSTIDVSNNPALVRLYVYNNPLIKKIKVYKNSRVELDNNPLNISSNLDGKLKEFISNSDIVKINDSGLLTGVSAGKTTVVGSISSTYAHYDVTFNVEVVEITSDKYTIDEDESYIYVDDDKDITTILNNISTVSQDVQIKIKRGNSYITSNNLDSTDTLVVLDGDNILKEYTIGSTIIIPNSLRLVDALLHRDDYIYTGYTTIDKLLNTMIIRNGSLKVLKDDKQVTSGKLDNTCKLLVIYHDKIIKEIPLVVFSANTYYERGNAFFVNSTNIETILSKISVNKLTYGIYKNGVKETTGILTDDGNPIYKLTVDSVTSDYITSITSDKYDINLNSTVLSVNESTVEDVLSHITVTGGNAIILNINGQEKTTGTLESGMILKVYNTSTNDYKSFNLVNIASDEAIVGSSSIIYLGSIRRATLLSKLSSSYTLQISDGINVVTSGSVENGDVLQVLDNSQELMQEYDINIISFSDSNNYQIIQKYIVSKETNIEQILNDFSITNGTLKVKRDDEYITTGTFKENDKLVVLSGNIEIAELNFIVIKSDKYNLNNYAPGSYSNILVDETNVVDIENNLQVYGFDYEYDFDDPEKPKLVLKDGSTTIMTFNLVIVDFKNNASLNKNGKIYVRDGVSISDFIENTTIINGNVAVLKNSAVVTSGEFDDDTIIRFTASTPYIINYYTYTKLGITTSYDISNGYIYTNDSVETIISKITPTTGTVKVMTYDKEKTSGAIENGDKVLIIDGTNILESYPLINYTSKIYDLSKDVLISTTTVDKVLLDIDGVNVNAKVSTIGEVNKTTGDIVLGDTLKIYYKDILIKSYDLIGISLGNYIVNNNKIYTEDNIETILSNVSSVGATFKVVNGETNKTSGDIETGDQLELVLNEEILATYDLAKTDISSDKYIVTDKYIKLTNDTMDVTTILENITTNLEKRILDDKDTLIESGNISDGSYLEIYTGDLVVKKLLLVSYDSIFYDLTKTRIITEDSIEQIIRNIDGTNINVKVATIGETDKTTGDIELGDTLKIYCNDELIMSYDLIGMSLGNYVVNNNKIYTEDNIETILSNVSSVGATFKVVNGKINKTSGDIETDDQLELVINEEILATYDLIKIGISSSEYDLSKNYIETTDSIDTILSNITTNVTKKVVNGNTSKTSGTIASGDKLQIVSGNEVIKEYSLVNYSFTDNNYDRTKEYIYTTDSIDEILSKVNVTGLTKQVLNNETNKTSGTIASGDNLVIKLGDTVLKSYSLVKFTTDEFINDNKIIVSSDSVATLISKLHIINGINEVTQNEIAVTEGVIGTNTKVVIKYNNIIKTYDVELVTRSSSKYDLSKDYIETTDSIDTILNNITTNVTKKVVNGNTSKTSGTIASGDKLQIVSGNEVIKEYSLVNYSFTDNTYDKTKDYIYTTDSIDEILSKVNVTGLTKQVLNNETNKTSGTIASGDNLVIKLGNTVLKSYSLVKFNSTYQLLSDKINVNKAKIEDLLFTVANGTYIIEKNGIIATTGNIENNTVVKIKYNNEVIKSYQLVVITVDYGTYKEKLNSTTGYLTILKDTLVSQINSALTTSGTIKYFDYKSNAEMLLTSKFKTGDKIKITYGDTSTSENTIVIKGDADGDGDILAKDALMAIKNSVGSLELTGAFKNAADYDNDGEILAKDALKIVRKSVGLE